jgi:hypothetical protein
MVNVDLLLNRNYKVKMAALVAGVGCGFKRDGGGCMGCCWNYHVLVCHSQANACASEVLLL